MQFNMTKNLYELFLVIPTDLGKGGMIQVG